MAMKIHVACFYAVTLHGVTTRETAT